jgi:glyoxylase I family protein
VSRDGVTRVVVNGARASDSVCSHRTWMEASRDPPPVKRISETMSKQNGRAAATPGIEGIGHVSLTVTELAVSVEWYQRVLGLVRMMEEEHPGGDALVLCTPDLQVIVALHRHDLNEGEQFEERRTGLDHVSFNVPNRAALEAWIARFDELGVEHGGIEEAPYGALVAFRDPDNIQLEMVSIGSA